MDRLKKDWLNGIMDFILPYEVRMNKTKQLIVEWKKSYEKQIVYDIANSFKKNKFDIIKQNFELMKLNKSHPQWLGDYDVFAVDINNKSIWIVECKVIEKVATFYDMYRQQNRFFNEHKEDEKFQRRIDYLRENADQVIQQLGCTDYIGYKVIPYMCMNKVLVSRYKKVQNKFLFIIVDAINENDSDGFGNQISAFINKIADYSRAKIVVSCRNEYYKERFRKYLVEKVNIPVFEFDLKEQHYTSTAINRIIKTYSNHFNYSGNISLAVKSVLSEQLLLLRIFFEVNKDSNADVYSIRKHEIFAQYIEKLKQNNREYLETVLDTVTDFMIHSDNYDEISITDLEKTGITSGDIRKTVNSGILLSKKLVFHEGTIARNEKEVVYFVFDEMRDYCLARQILLNNISAYNVDGESVIEKLKQLKATGASCTEGVIHYCYVFFKTDELVSKLGQTEKMCNSILDLYRIPEGGERKSYWSMRYREELQNLGLRIILTSGLELTDFEITYIQDCLRKDPYEDGGMFFDTMLDGTLYGGIYNLDIYLGILFGLKNKDAILNTFHTISARNNMDDRFIPEDFIKYYNELSDSERKLQIQKIAELFLLCFKLHDKDKQEELEDFFYNLPTHDKVQNDMILEMRIACGLEVKDYE